MFEVEKRGVLSGWVNNEWVEGNEWVKEEREERLKWARNNGYTIYIGKEGRDYVGETRHYIAVKHTLEIVPLFSTNKSWVASGNAFPPTHYYFYIFPRKIKVKRKLHSPLLSFKFMGVVFSPF